MKISDEAARRVLDDAAAASASALMDRTWAAKIEKLSELCEGAAKTHIAAFGTALLAKATDINVDVFALKVEGNGPRAYSARQLAKNVLAKGALVHRFDIGVSGPEPLNNQPYFREARISRDMPVRPKSRPVIDYLCTMLTQLDPIGDVDKVRNILTTFIALRRKRVRQYAILDATGSLNPAALTKHVTTLVSANAEGGKRAQAVVAAIYDVIYGEDRVEAGRVNDPSRRIPGDVLIAAADGGDQPIKSIEVRDKPVELTDVLRFRDRASVAGVNDLAFVAVSIDQAELDLVEFEVRIAEGDATMRLYFDWATLINEALYWAEGGVNASAQRLVAAVRDRLIALEASEEAVAHWAELVRDQS